ncbi:uncharacterized protein LOC119983330 isoform X2 [Tripterygium wilfordii]|uniref:uncharacterized protein LOC119983330 isoform X2 n=1 Tax=Tripterygium wilfordii TaxID=458696 RepID=UPI0018F829D0|nr:uncharacterized protein LOC119983330 isoform X2 [Tripterygium wilfordii]
MDESEFRRLLNLFPVVRPRDYHVDLDPSRQSTSRSTQNEEWQDAWGEADKNKLNDQGIVSVPQDPFWEKLRSAAVRKVGAAEAERLCEAFQQVHNRLVHEEMTVEGALKFLNSS